LTILNGSKLERFRNEAMSWLSVSSHFHYASITYRGLRRIDELRDHLRRDRILEKFGILLDGRYITSDLIYFLERADGEPVSFLLGGVDDFKRFNSDYGV
jgi:GGDEF domain-containing protein